MYSSDDQPVTPRQAMPDWLINEQLSPQGGRLRDEWAKQAREAGEDRGRARLAAAMLRMRTQRPTSPLLARANAKSLRWVDATIRRGRVARRLREVVPNLPMSHRLVLRAHQFAMPVAAGFVLLLCKSGAFSALEAMSRFADRLAKLHFDRHIDPPSMV